MEDEKGVVKEYWLDLCKTDRPENYQPNSYLDLDALDRNVSIIYKKKCRACGTSLFAFEKLICTLCKEIEDAKIT